MVLPPGVDPHQSIQRIITERLVVRQALPTRRGHRRGKLKHIAHIVEGARQTPERRAGSSQRRTARHQAPDPIIAQRRAEERRWHTGLVCLELSRIWRIYCYFSEMLLFYDKKFKSDPQTKIKKREK